MYVVDVADPQRPHIVAHLGDLGNPEEIVAVSGHVFLLDHDANRWRHTKQLDESNCLGGQEATDDSG
jgi:hypothetical protein